MFHEFLSTCFIQRVLLDNDVDKVMHKAFETFLASKQMSTRMEKKILAQINKGDWDWEIKKYITKYTEKLEAPVLFDLVGINSYNDEGEEEHDELNITGDDIIADYEPDYESDGEINIYNEEGAEERNGLYITGDHLIVDPEEIWISFLDQADDDELVIYNEEGEEGLNFYDELNITGDDLIDEARPLQDAINAEAWCAINRYILLYTINCK